MVIMVLEKAALQFNFLILRYVREELCQERGESHIFHLSRNLNFPFSVIVPWLLVLVRLPMIMTGELPTHNDFEVTSAVPQGQLLLQYCSYRCVSAFDRLFHTQVVKRSN